MFFNCLAWNNFSNLDYSIDMFIDFLEKDTKICKKTKIVYFNGLVISHIYQDKNVSMKKWYLLYWN